MYQVFTGTEPRLQILPKLGVASHRQALYGTVTHVICNASPSRSVFFRTVFFPFSFCRSSPPLRFFFFSFLYFFLSRSLSFPFPFPSILLFFFSLHDIFFISALPRGYLVFLTVLVQLSTPQCLHCCTHCSCHRFYHFCWVSVPRLDVVRDPPLRRLSLAVDTQDSYALVNSNVRLTFSLQ